WSADVCSSDLELLLLGERRAAFGLEQEDARLRGRALKMRDRVALDERRDRVARVVDLPEHRLAEERHGAPVTERAEELEDADVERGARPREPHARRVEPDRRLHPEEEADHVAVLDHHALGPA